MEVDLFGRLAGVADRDANGVHEVLVDEVGDGGLDGGREEQRLTNGGEKAHDALDGGQEAHIEHPVGFIKDEQVDRIQANQAAFDKIAEAARGGNNDLDTALDVGKLRTFTEAAYDDCGTDTGAGGQFVERLRNLHREFASGAQDKGLGAFGRFVFQEAFEEGEDKSKGLASARLGCGDKVFAF